MVLEGLAASWDDAIQTIQAVRPIANPDAVYRGFGQRYIANF